MGKPEWGTKRTCQNCGARFYDLGREPITCPVCSTVLDPERQIRPRRGGRSEAPAAAVPAVVVDETEALDETVDIEADVEEESDDVAIADDNSDIEAGEEVSELDSSEEDEDLIEDTSELGEDDDDIGEVIEHIDDDLGEKG